MDLEISRPSTSLVKCCDCGCTCSSLMNRSLSGTGFRSVKRKVEEYDDEGFVIPGLSVPQVVRVEIENEVDVLRETVGNQLEKIEELYSELEEERYASASAADEALSMILRLQREMAEIKMEAKQFKRFAEEKMTHDQQEVLVLEDVLYKREQSIHSLTCEVQSYKHRIMSYGFTEEEVDGDGGLQSRMMIWNSSAREDNNLDDQFDFPSYDYPRLKCNLNENHLYSEADNEVPYDVEKYAFGEFPTNQPEMKPKSIEPDGEKVIVGQSPRRSRHRKDFSTDSTASTSIETEFTYSPNLSTIKTGDDLQLEEYPNLKDVDNAFENEDVKTDRIYTVDSVHQNGPYKSVAESKASIGVCDDYMKTPREALNHTDFGDLEVKKMYMRLQALEADRESMRQAIISMRADKAQLVLLKEIAQHLYKEMPPPRRPIVAKPSLFGVVSFMTVCKWIMSLAFWKNKARHCRYMFGKSSHNPGLLLLLNKGPHVGQWRCFSRIQM